MVSKKAIATVRIKITITAKSDKNTAPGKSRQVQREQIWRSGPQSWDLANSVQSPWPAVAMVWCWAMGSVCRIWMLRTSSLGLNTRWGQPF